MNQEQTNLITASHLGRKAFVYVRQSTARQVAENTESTRRQYALGETAKRLGWQSEQIEVVDCDQGVSGTRVADRPGFQRLMSEVTMGRAGIVLGLEVSRLARNCSDWHRLVEVCAMTSTLLCDQDGLYDPTSFNHQLVLGIKGLLSAVEVGVIRARMRQALLAKASRGELRLGLPVGFVYDEQGTVRLHPDRQIRDSVQLLFETFRRTGTAGATVKHFRDRSVLFPRPANQGGATAEVVWSPLQLQTVVRMLHNPRYAGAFAYGRRRKVRRVDGGYRTEKIAQDQWHTLLRDAHEGYISWDDFVHNESQLSRSAQAHGLNNRRTPPREGPALLQGLVMCGVCGSRMTVRYHDRAGGLVPEYQCISGRMHGRRPTCQVIGGTEIDAAVAARLVEAMTPMAIELTLAVQAELRARLNDAEQLRQMAVERCRHEAELARRRYMLVDPDNRLVADTLEADYNEKLRSLAQARDEADRHTRADRATLDEATEQRIRALAGDFREVFDNPTTSSRDRKRMARLLVEDVTLVRTDSLQVHIRFKGGATDTLTLPLPQNAWHRRLTSPTVVARVDELLAQCDDEHQVASRLNADGLRTGAGRQFDGAAVKWIRYVHGLQSAQQRLRSEGHLTVDEAAERLGLSSSAVRGLLRNGELRGRRLGRKPTWLIEPLETQAAEFQQIAATHVTPPEPNRKPPPRGTTLTPGLKERLDELVRLGHTDAHIATILDSQGERTATGRPLDSMAIARLRRQLGVLTLFSRRIQDGQLSTSQMAAHLGFGLKTIARWAQTGKLRGRRAGAGPHAPWTLAPIAEQPPEIRQLAAQRTTLPRHHGVLSAAAAGRGAL